MRQGGECQLHAGTWHARAQRQNCHNQSEWVRPAYKKKARDRLAPCSRPRLDASEENASEEAVTAEKKQDR